MGKIHEVVDLRHPDDRACYYCFDKDDKSRWYYKHYGPNPNLLSKHRSYKVAMEIANHFLPAQL